MATRTLEEEIRFDAVLRNLAEEARSDGDQEAANRLLGLCLHNLPAEEGRTNGDLFVPPTHPPRERRFNLAPSGFGGTTR